MLGNDAGAQTTATAIGLCSGTYFIQVTDAASCIQFSSPIIDSPPAINLSANIIDATCVGICDGGLSVNVTGGIAGYTYAWLPGGEQPVL